MPITILSHPVLPVMHKNALAFWTGVPYRVHRTPELDQKIQQEAKSWRHKLLQESWRSPRNVSSRVLCWKLPAKICIEARITKCYLSRFIQLCKAQHLVLQQLLCWRPQFCCVQYYPCDIAQRTSSPEYSVIGECCYPGAIIHLSSLRWLSDMSDCPQTKLYLNNSGL